MTLSFLGHLTYLGDSLNVISYSDDLIYDIFLQRYILTLCHFWFNNQIRLCQNTECQITACLLTVRYFPFQDKPAEGEDGKEGDEKAEEGEEKAEEGEEKGEDKGEEKGENKLTEAKAKMKEALDKVHMPKIPKPKIHKPAFLKKKKEGDAANEEKKEGEEGEEKEEETKEGNK